MTEQYGFRTVDDALNEYPGGLVRFRKIEPHGYECVIYDSMNARVYERVALTVALALGSNADDLYFFAPLQNALNGGSNFVSFYGFALRLHCSIEDAETKEEIAHGEGTYANDALKEACSAYESAVERKLS